MLPDNSSIEVVVFSSFHGWGNQDTKKLNNISKVNTDYKSDFKIYSYYAILPPDNEIILSIYENSYPSS